MDILLTGATGFLGRTLLKALREHNIITLSRSGSSLNFSLDKGIPLLPPVDLVIHSAGKAHVTVKNGLDDTNFYETNVLGTNNLLKGIEDAGIPKSFIFISSVAVYGRSEGHSIGEGDPLLATDPYGLSKIRAEELVSKWCDDHGVICSILRLPLVVGPTPPGNLKLMLASIEKGYYFNVAGGKAKRSMVLAQDVAKIILKVAKVGGTFNLTDGYHPSIRELSEAFAKQLGKRIPLNLPLWMATVMAKVGDVLGEGAPINSRKLNKIVSSLTFDDSKAQRQLRWNPKKVLEGLETTDS